MEMTWNPVGSSQSQNQPAADKVASSLYSHAGTGRRTAPAATTIDGIGNHVTGAATGSTPSSSTSASSAGDITSNDFLTLLVTEMKNQDPTQPTDPNAYIQQLVGVNSLQQLIAINNDLTPGTVSSASGAAIGPVTAGAAPSPAGNSR